MSDDEMLWDPDRLHNIGSVLSRYSVHLRKDDRIVLGMQGDPCNKYRSAEEAPRGTVLDVRRESNGEVHFSAQLEGSDAVVHLNNRNVSPEALWEIDPEYLDTFRARIEQGDEDDDEPAYEGNDDEEEASAPQTYAGAPDEVEYRSSVETQFGRLEQQLQSIQTNQQQILEENRVFSETTASTIRALAGDLMRASKGDDIQFAQNYIDRYDVVIAERASSASPTPDGFRAAHYNAHQSEKYDFEEEESPHSPYRGHRGSPVSPGEVSDEEDKL